MADLLLRASTQAGGSRQSQLTPAQQQAVNQALLTIAASSEQTQAVRGVIRAARALKRAQDDQTRAREGHHPDAAAMAAEMAREAEAALVRAVARMPPDESRPMRQPSSSWGWTRMAFG